MHAPNAENGNRRESKRDCVCERESRTRKKKPSDRLSINVTIIYLYRGSVCGKGEIIIFNIRTCATEKITFGFFFCSFSAIPFCAMISLSTFELKYDLYTAYYYGLVAAALHAVCKLCW